MDEPKENKGMKHSPYPLPKGEGNKVKVKINHNRAVAGVGKSDEVVTVTEQEAQRLVAQGMATIVKEN